MTEAASAKKQLREALRLQAAGLERAYLEASDVAIARRVEALKEWQSARTIFIYISVRTEPDTRGLIAAATAAGKRVCVPRCLPGAVMEARQITSIAQCWPAAFGLLEADETAALVPPNAIDFVVAPCVAADRNGRRLGNGAGYYDCFLKQVTAPVACLCRGRLLQNALPQEPFDVVVDMVITERELLCVTRPGN